MTLEDVVRYILTHAPAAERDRFVAWFREGRPLGTGCMVDPDGNRCLLGAMLPEDATYQQAMAYETFHQAFPWMTIADQAWHPWDRGFDDLEDKRRQVLVVIDDVLTPA